jgi:hypothetical protein
MYASPCCPEAGFCRHPLTGRILPESDPVAQLCRRIGWSEVQRRMIAILRREWIPGCSDRAMSELRRLIDREVVGLAPEKYLE